MRENAWGVVCTYAQEMDPSRCGDCSLADPSLAALALCSVPTCSKLLRRPHLTTCCGKNICAACVDGVGAQAARPFCPVPNCGHPERFGASLNRAHMKTVLEYEVRCGSQKIGCRWRGKLSGYDSHQRECPLAVVNCDFCHISLERRHHSTHLDACEMYPMKCPNGCQMIFLRRDLTEHRETCRMEMISCPFVQYDCCRETQVRRMHLADHLDSACSAHWKAVKESGQTLEKGWKDTLENLAAMREMMLAEKEAEIAALKRELEEANDKVGALQNQLRGLERSIENFREESRRAREDLAGEVHMTKKQQLDRLRVAANELRIVTLSKCYGPPVPRPPQIVPRPIPPTGEVFYQPPFDLSITNFKQRREDNEIWLSPPLFSHRGGYKLCVQVYPAGNQSGYLTFVSVYVAIMKGENDDFLRWPFSGRIDLCLLTQYGGPSVVKHTIAMGRSCDVNLRQRVRDGIFNEGYGTNTFVNHPTADKFLCNGTMKLRVNIRVD